MRPLFLQMSIEATQRAEDLAVVFVVGAYLHTIRLGDHERHFENVDRVEAESVTIQRRRRIDFLSRHVEVESGDDELRERKLLCGRGRSRLYFGLLHALSSLHPAVDVECRLDLSPLDTLVNAL